METNYLSYSPKANRGTSLVLTRLTAKHHIWDMKQIKACSFLYAFINCYTVKFIMSFDQNNLEYFEKS